MIECDMESCYKSISKIRNIKFNFQNLQQIFKYLKKNDKTYMDSEIGHYATREESKRLSRRVIVTARAKGGQQNYTR